MTMSLSGAPAKRQRRAFCRDWGSTLLQILSNRIAAVIIFYVEEGFRYLVLSDREQFAVQSRSFIDILTRIFAIFICNYILFRARKQNHALS